MIIEVLGIKRICMSGGERKDVKVSRMCVYICMRDPNRWEGDRKQE